MWASRYFTRRYWTERFWPSVGAEAAASIVQARGTYRPILSAQATVAWHPGPFDPAIFDEDIFDTFRMAPVRATASYVPVVTAKGRTS